MIKLHNNYNIIYDYNGTTGNIYSNQNWNLFYNKDISYFADGCTNLNLKLDNDNINYVVNGANTIGHINFQYVENMAYTFNGCHYLTGIPEVVSNVINMSHAYSDCWNISGEPYCGNDTIDMNSAYYNCVNLVGSPVCKGRVTNFEYAYYNCKSITGNPVCGSSVINMAYTYYNCNLTGNPRSYYFVKDMTSTYENCLLLNGNPVCGDEVSEFNNTYKNCVNLIGSPVCGNSVINFNSTYENCYLLNGLPACSSTVVSMMGTYANCTNIIGSPACSNSVIYFQNAYINCYNLNGAASCGDNVINASHSYYGCKNLINVAPMMNSVINASHLYYGCNNISGKTYIHSDSIDDMENCFYGHDNNYPLTLYIKRNSPLDKNLLNWYSGIEYSQKVNLFGKSITYSKITKNNGYKNLAYNIMIYNNLNHTVGHYIVPTQLSNLYYTGENQSLVLKDFYPDTMSVITKSSSDRIKAINAGTYTAWASLTYPDNSVWDVDGDEVIEDQKITWSIEKRPSIISMRSEIASPIGSGAYSSIDFIQVDSVSELTINDYVAECYDADTGDIIIDSDDAPIKTAFVIESGTIPNLHILYWNEEWKSCPGNYIIKVYTKETQNYAKSNVWEIKTSIKVESIKVPTQIEISAYTSNPIIPKWDDFTQSLIDSGYLKVEILPEILPGSYTAKFTPVSVNGKYRYVWEDEPVTGERIVNWSISKAKSNGILDIVDENNNSISKVTFTNDITTQNIYVVINESETWDTGCHGNLVWYSDNNNIVACSTVQYIESGAHAGQFALTLNSNSGGESPLDIWFDEGLCYFATDMKTITAVSNKDIIVIFNQFSDNDSNLSILNIEFI